MTPLIDGHNDYPWALRELDLDYVTLDQSFTAVAFALARLGR